MTQHPRPLPGDAYLAELLGWSEDQLLQYQVERQQAAAIENARNPPAATCDPGTLAVVSLVTTILSVGYSVLSMLLAPKSRRPGQIKTKQQQGETFSDGARFASRPGFDSTQQVARLGSVIPIVFARREYLPALNGRPEGFYGGCRVDLDLLWSQMVSLGGSQMFRGVYMIGEGPMAEIDPEAFAIGNNPLRSYDLATDSANESSSRLTIYSRLGGGRIRSTDRVAGRLAANDLGNMENLGAADVFQLLSIGGAIRPDASAVARPGSSTACGLYATIGNGLGYRVNPQLRPTRQIATEPIGTSGDQRIEPEDDPVALGSTWKARRMWSGRSGIVATSTGVTSGNAALAVGATFDYLLSNTSDAITRLRFNRTNTDSEVDHTETCSDVAAAISGRQRSADDALVQGDLFKCGSALAVLESRTPSDQLFSSEADNQPVGGGQSITCRFRVVRAGVVVVTPSTEINPPGTSDIQYPPDVSASNGWDWTAVSPGPRYATGTSRGHLHRCAIADFTLSRPAKVVEIGIRSSVGIRGSGFANLRQIPNLREINRKAGGERAGETLRAGDKLNVALFQTGSRSFSEERFAFFRLTYRIEGQTTFTELPTLYGVRGMTQQAQFNSLQLELPGTARCSQIRLEPISGWELRSGVATGLLAILDSRLSGFHSIADGAAVVRYSGEARFTRSAERFALDSIEPDDRSSVGTLVTTTAAVQAFPGTYTNVQLVQDGRDKGGRATVVVPGAGGFNSSNITITNTGFDYNGGPIVLANGNDGGSAVISARTFTITGGFPLSGFDRPLVVSGDAPPPRAGSRVSFTSTGSLPEPLVPGRTYFVRQINVFAATQFTVSLTAGGAAIPITTPGTGTITCAQWVNAFDITADLTTDRLTVTGGPNAPVVGTQLQIAAETLMPTPLVAGTSYWVVANPTPTTMQVSATAGGAVINITGNGGGVITARIVNTTNWAGFSGLGKTDIGLGWSDADALVDPWGKVAEAFIYDEIQSTASQGPEHEIAFVNPIQANTTIPTYAGIATIGLNIRSALEFQSVNQVSAQIIGGHICPRFIEGTAGPTHLVPDLFSRLALSPEFGAGLEVSAEQINTASFLAAAQWCFERRYFFDGPMPGPENLRQWAADQASLHLLSFYELNGQFYFKPALSFDPVPIVDLFTAANIKKGTFRSTTSDDDQRRPIQVSGLYRDERANDDILAPGMFATVREITIREASASESDPVEPLDMAESCTNRWHLIDAAKFLIRYRRLVGDPITFETTYAGMLRPIAPEDHIAVAYDETLEDLYSNGAVMPDGTLVASEPLADGSYEVLAWDGTTPPGPTIQSLVVSGGGTRGNLLGSAWTRTAPPQVRTYRVMRVSPTEDGRQRIDAVLMPTDDDGRLLLVADWDDPTAWVITGADTVAPPFLPTITLSISAASVLEDGATNLIYTFTRNGSTTGSLVVNYSIGGTATNGVDYAAIGTSVTIPSGSSTATVTVNPTADTVLEPDETVSLSLGLNAAYLIGTPGAVIGTILNDDAAAFSINDVSILEGSAGTSPAVFTVTLNNAVAGGAAVSFATADGTATAGSDYIATSGTLNFTGNAGETQTISVIIYGDTVVEPDEFFFVNLFAPTKGATLADSQGVCTILNNSAPLVTLAVSPASVLEDGATNLIYTFTRSGETTDSLVVNYSIGGTATNGVDYVTIGTSVTIPAGSLTATVTVDPTADSVPEADETVSLTLLANAAYLIGTSGAVTGTILNDDFGQAPDIVPVVGGVTISVDQGTTIIGTIPLISEFVLVSIQVNKAGWLRLYNSNAALTADAGRLRQNEPARDSGVMADPVFLGAETINYEPVVVCMNREAPLVNAYPFRLTNDGPSGTYTFTVTYLPISVYV